MSAQRPAKPAPANPAEATSSKASPNPAPRDAGGGGRSQNRPPRPEGGQRPPRPDGGQRKPRPEGAQRPPRQPQPVRMANPLPEITFPEALPVSARRDEIAQALLANQVVIVSGETGSGKTTQLPKIALSVGRGPAREDKPGGGLIGHTQPRRIAATSTAKRIAQELGTPVGEHVGYQVRFNDAMSAGASVKLMTDGILLAETQNDPLLRAYDTIIIDEAHERSLNIDFLIGYLRQILPKRPDLKVIITSATIDARRFAEHFGRNGKPAPVIEVSGRLYPVEIRYRPIQEDKPAPGQMPAAPRSEKAKERDLYDGIVDAVDELCRLGPGDVLVFLPGEREIREAAEALRKHHPPHTEILPLFARLSVQEQERVFRPSNARRIVLATNVAETSLTVPGIRYVVDTGLARVKRYSYRNKVEQLQIESISQAAANQRAGRCGRVADGVCIRLYEESDFLGRPRFTDPEILRSSLAAVILRMKALRLTDIEAFPFIEPPLGRAVADGYQLLQELGALDEGNQLTNTGRQLAKLPLDPRVARMILAARDHHCLKEVLIIASALSVQDPRERPQEAQEAADQAHRKFMDEKSEFLGWVKLWKWFEEAIAHKKTNRQLQDQCRSNFLSHVRLREWRDVHSQLHTTVSEQGWRLNDSEPTFEQLHKALLTGLLGNVGLKLDEADGKGREYLGARGIKFHLWPGSLIARKVGRWIIAAELVETSRLYGRTLARVEPEWVEQVGKHLLKVSWSEPHWEKKAGQVLALERGTLYGLPVYQHRRVDFGPMNPGEARELFIRSALVEGEFDTKLPFFAHNQRLVREIENLEHKSRRQDVLVDDVLIYAFYDQVIPADIHNQVAFEKWYQAESAKDRKLLYLNRDELMRHEAAGITTDLFPKILPIAGIDMGLSYHFEPGSHRDGVTLTVPLYALNQVRPERADWLVPGMIKEKVHLLLKSLPQKLRRHCVPLPDYAAGFVERQPFGEGDLLDVLIADVREQTGTMIRRADFKLETLPAHHAMNFKVIDEHGRQLDMGRNLAQLRAELGGQAQQSFQNIAARDVPAAEAGQYENLTSWSFGELPELLEIRKGNQTLFGYPALVDRGDHCDVEVFDDPQEAARIHHAGLRRLFALQLREQVKFIEKNIPNLQQMAMQYMTLGTQEELRNQIVLMALERACLQAPLPRNEAEFNARKEEGRARLSLLAQEIARLVGTILAEFASLPRKLLQAKPFGSAYQDLEAQLGRLMHKTFVIDTPYTQLVHYPRYLKGMAMRVDKLKGDPGRDSQRIQEMSPLVQQWQRAEKQIRSQGRGAADARLDEFRWMLEELRVALFAQELRTPQPISVKRLQKVWESIQR
ncbi:MULTISPECIES: ATP-dependent RNA helicase HrpA [unclassified Cupriavidus]|uniref:ATP-dependent RNA helicase HrpA n=1 Tax=unclassified Cupriavidus TaxID=2640874 RepID=UPI001C006DF2|nr:MULTISPECIES: ATP-dependent RNA helicase HrpA [unclassified Cupriavidus]MCA3191597.1 ATP-dependent RNA helicase HrpA [Cupriavidus sp.]MCA3199808.1 ATP-dependent RNA helicase HrpA [Cupriavidus sp.]MCA3201642.1 ATP-dependent RNA helicase HrpA [Cupriavidus sp.]MCA3205651.1 ATP-dependent RNA helicase HrpA [Cupriavidus sp.]QWE93375.1 ATP-dependent RNA helicase HrpA [Cupriavidus sp. EM10]